MQYAVKGFVIKKRFIICIHYSLWYYAVKSLCQNYFHTPMSSCTCNPQSFLVKEKSFHLKQVVRYLGNENQA